jgi:hypothetical protein
MSQAIKNLLNENHDKAIGQFMDEWGESADGETALLSIAASLRQVVVELNALRQAIIKNGSNR